MKFFKKIILLCLLFCLTSCMELAYRKAVGMDSIKAYENYLNNYQDNYPESKYAVFARERLEDLYYVEARFKDNFSAYEDFLKRYPNSKYSSDVGTSIIVHEVTNVLSYQDYLLPFVGQGDNVASVSFANKTGVPLRMLVVGREVFSDELGINQNKTFHFQGNTIIVFKDDKRTFSPGSYIVDVEDKIGNVELWLEPKNKLINKLKIIETDKNQS